MRFKILLVLVLLTFNSGCTDSSNLLATSYDSNPPNLPNLTTNVSLNGLVSAGPIAASTVNVYQVNSDGSQGPLLATAATTSSGSYTIQSVSSQNAVVMLVANGGSFIEEGSGQSTNLGSQSMQAMIVWPPEFTASPITPLTHIAARRAAFLMSQGQDPFAAVSDANAAVATAAGLYTVLDVTAINPADPTQTLATQGLAASDPATHYAMALAGLSQFASMKSSGGNTLTSLDVMNAFALDFQGDGEFNGLDQNSNSIALGSGLLGVNDWTTGLSTAQAAYLAGNGRTPGFSNLSENTMDAVPPSQFLTPSSPSSDVAYSVNLVVSQTPVTNVCNSIELDVNDGFGNIIAAPGDTTVMLEEIDSGYGDSYDQNGTLIALYGSLSDCQSEANALSASLFQTPAPVLIPSGQNSVVAYYRVDSAIANLGVEFISIVVAGPSTSGVSFLTSENDTGEIYLSAD